MRALYRAGGTLRKLGLSHQRVHQLLDLPARPGARGPGRRSPEPRSAVRKLIAGPSVAVCSDGVVLVTQAVRHGTPAADARASVSPAGPAQACSFCGKGPHEVPAMAQADSGSAVICAECLDLCNEILVEVQPVISLPGGRGGRSSSGARSG